MHNYSTARPISLNRGAHRAREIVLATSGEGECLRNRYCDGPTPPRPCRIPSYLCAACHLHEPRGDIDIPPIAAGAERGARTNRRALAQVQRVGGYPHIANTAGNLHIGRDSAASRSDHVLRHVEINAHPSTIPIARGICGHRGAVEHQLAASNHYRPPRAATDIETRPGEINPAQTGKAPHLHWCCGV